MNDQQIADSLSSLSETNKNLLASINLLQIQINMINGQLTTLQDAMRKKNPWWWRGPVPPKSNELSIDEVMNNSEN